MHSFFYSLIDSLLVQYIMQAMSSLTEDNCMRIPKLKEAKNYRPRAIYVQAALEIRKIWEIVITTKVAPMEPEDFADKNVKDKYTSYIQEYASVKGILILSIDLSILIDNYTTSLVNKI